MHWRWYCYAHLPQTDVEDIFLIEKQHDEVQESNSCGIEAVVKIKSTIIPNSDSSAIAQGSNITGSNDRPGETVLDALASLHTA